MNIRPLKNKDADQVFAIVRALTTPGIPQWTLKQWQDELAAARGLGLFGDADDLQAFILYRESARTFDISFLASQKDMQRTGLMTTLVNEFLDRSGPVAEIWLEFHERNIGAQLFYEKLGFQQTGRREAYYSDGAAAILCSLTLSDS